MVRVANLGVNGTAIPPARHTPMYKEAKRAPGLQTPTDKRPVTHVVCSIREICSSKNDKNVRDLYQPTFLSAENLHHSPPLRENVHACARHAPLDGQK